MYAQGYPGRKRQPISRLNEPLSISPLTWSHANFIIVVQEYLNKLLEIEKCMACDQSKYSKRMMKKE